MLDLYKSLARVANSHYFRSNLIKCAFSQSPNSWSRFCSVKAGTKCWELGRAESEFGREVIGRVLWIMHRNRAPLSSPSELTAG